MATNIPPTHIEVEGDKPKVEATTRYFAELRASLKNGLDVQRELGMEVAALMTERDQLREAVEALVGVMPYLHPNPNSPNAKEWAQWREAALDKAATALDHFANPS